MKTVFTVEQVVAYALWCEDMAVDVDLDLTPGDDENDYPFPTVGDTPAEWLPQARALLALNRAVHTLAHPSPRNTPYGGADRG